MKILEKNRNGPIQTALRAADGAALWSEGAHLLLAVSGGADSIALLHALAIEREALRFGALTVASIDHGLRPEAREEIATVERLAGSLGLPFLVRTVEIIRGREDGGLQEAARRARQEGLEALRAQAGADRIVTAHSASDQAETILLRVARGTSPAGLAAIRPQQGRYLRPLLGCTRPQLRAYCEEHALRFHDDPGNADTRFDRAWVRHELLPLLRSRLNPRIEEALGRLGSLASEDEAHLGQLAEALGREASLPGGEGFDVGVLVRAPAAVTRRVLIAAWRRAGAENLRPEASFVEEILARLQKGLKTPWERSLPGRVSVFFRGGRLRFGPTPEREKKTGGPSETT